MDNNTYLYKNIIYYGVGIVTHHLTSAIEYIFILFNLTIL